MTPREHLNWRATSSRRVDVDLDVDVGGVDVDEDCDRERDRGRPQATDTGIHPCDRLYVKCSQRILTKRFAATL